MARARFLLFLSGLVLFAGLLLIGCSGAGGGDGANFSALEGESQTGCLDRCEVAGFDAETCERVCTEIDAESCYTHCLESGGDEVGCRERCYDGEGGDEVGQCIRDCQEEGFGEEECRERCYDGEGGDEVGQCIRDCQEEGFDEEECRERCAD